MTSTSPTTDTPLRLRFDRFELDEADARLTQAGQAVPLAPRPFAVLCALARSPQRLVTKNDLLDAVWGHRHVTESVLKTTISELRAALQDDPRNPRCIETVSRRGYRFIAAVGELAPAAAALPAAGAPGFPQPGRAPLIGRVEQLEHLRKAWRRAEGGRRQVVWVAGETGVGKTTLIESFIAQVGEAHCAHGQCVGQYGSGEPYLPVLEALSELCRRDPALAGLVRAIAPTWFLQLPWLSTETEREALRQELSGVGQARMPREMGELLDRYTEQHPLLLVTEDLHWGDQATIQLMDYVARRRGPARLMWLGSFRYTEVTATDHPLGAVRHELRLHGLAEEIVLDAFSEREVADYLAQRIPALASEEAIVRAVHARTDGLPLFVMDAVNTLAEEGGLIPADEASALQRLPSLSVPESLSGIVEGYVGQLTPEQRALLEVASVCGTEFDLATVARVMETDEASLASPCVELARGRRWLSSFRSGSSESPPGARYGFRHALYREVLYGRIGPLPKARLHARVAEALEEERRAGRKVSAAELATHFDLGRQPMPAVRCYAEAAESALLLFSPAQAMDLADRGLALLPQVEAGSARAMLEATLAALQGTAAIQVHGIGALEVKRPFERALGLLDRIPEHPLRGLFVTALGLALYSRGEGGEALALAQRLEASSAADRDPTIAFCACFVHGLVQQMRGRPRAARDWLQEAGKIAQGLEKGTAQAVFIADPGVIALGLLAIDWLNLGCVEKGQEHLRAALARAGELRAPGPALAASWLEALFAVRMDDPGHVAKVAERIGALSEEHELPPGRAACLWFRGWALARLGDPAAGYRSIRQGHEEAQRLGLRAWESEVLGYAAEALALSGDWAAARKQLAEAVQSAEAIGHREYAVQLLLLDARIADALEEPERARESIHQALEEALAQEAPWLELTALTARCQRPEATTADRRSLERVVTGLTGGLDALPLARARALLQGRG